MNVFIDKWLDFVAGAHYETTATTSDGLWGIGKAICFLVILRLNEEEFGQWYI